MTEQTSVPTPWQTPRATGPVLSTVSLPGSKSMTARALVLSAAAVKHSSLAEPLIARDTTLMAGALRAMGVGVNTAEDNLWVIRPQPLHGPADIDCGLAGTVMRFVPPLAALATGAVRFDGDAYARERPMGPLLKALSAIGVQISDEGRGALPFVIHGTGSVRGGELTVDASKTSQLISGLLLSAADFDRGLVLRHIGPPVPSAPHIQMTIAMIRAAGGAVDDSRPNVWEVEPGQLTGRAWEIEPDLSNAAPFLAAALVTGGEVTIAGWPHNTTQPGDALRGLLTEMGGECVLDDRGLTVKGTGRVKGIDADLSDVSELTPAVAALCALADSPSTLRGVAHIRGHETNRLEALATELNRLGCKVEETDDGLRIAPRRLTGAVFETYADHRMAQAGAILGLVVDGISLDDVACTTKTLSDFPGMWTRMLEDGS
ncbi:3-phosphoshikimate 1-carboxyvinyltransferase [Phytomonospora endophytica]|uniref:3-phosphoshikimate 1-carboxyvinyltransferase n=1 Tax=Phytomonospora endophytica TaxID=714109 RepID=A0A841FPE5_9ACTN|nr:3-phosphoshikimate 1-carboxyvinyltransferase [Phytomonospora endophytica]MBB6039181.1 3-phosphoshikimate 1-carboxyvinyltransferase [Phytomonospora endophytica]GIG67582.1 3-phosphoshikimate 1-carboxyvinyltransferase 1 [Phytomonospora endophytica]